MQARSDDDIIQGILAHNSEILRYVYTTMYGKIESFILKNNGTIEEAKDVFQESLIALYQNLHLGKYQKNSSTQLASYFYQICKFKWYSILRSAHKRKMTESLDGQLPGQFDISFEEDKADWDENKFVRVAITKLGKSCQHLLNAFYYEEKSMKEIAAMLGQQPNSVKNAKYRCIQKLKELIKTR